MKKLFLALLFLTVLMFPMQSWGTGTVTQTIEYTHNFYVLTFSWTSNAAGNASKTSTWPISGYIVKVITNPGSTAPSANYDITLTNSDGIDVVHGELANRHTATSEEIVPVPSNNVTVYGGSAVEGLLTLNVTNAGSSKEGVVKVIFERAGY